MTFKDQEEEFAYAHFIIQVADIFLDKYVPSETSNTHPENLLFAIIYMLISGKDADKGKMILESLKAKHDLYGEIASSLIYFNNGHKSAYYQLAKYLYGNYFRKFSKDATESDKKDFVKSFFLFNLLDIYFISKLGLNYDARKITNENLINELIGNSRNMTLENKTLEYLSLFNGKDPESSSTIIGGIYKNMKMAFLQYYHYDKIRVMAEKSEKINRENLFEEEFSNYINHLKYIKKISQDIFNLMDSTNETFTPSEEYINGVFYIASLLFLTEYDRSVTINKKHFSEYLDAIGKKKFLLDETKRRVSKIITDAWYNEIKSKKIIKAFNPLGFYLPEYFGFNLPDYFFQIWISWIIIWILIIISPIIFFKKYFLEVFFHAEFTSPIFYNLFAMVYTIASYVYLILTISKLVKELKKYIIKVENKEKV
jgi:hypothetical protein